MITIKHEEAGIISSGRCWVVADDKGYLYIDESFFRLVWVLITEWRNDKHIVGY